jgi:hypothetical protein
MAVGIRADEIDRMQPSAPKKKIIYPLIKASANEQRDD